MDPLGAAATIAHLIKRAIDFYNACRSAPSEFKIAARHARSMALILESIDADLIQNKSSTFHQTTAIAQNRRAQLKTHLRSCQIHLKSLENLLAEYRRNRVGWAAAGKAKVAGAQADLMMATTELNTYMTAQGLNVLSGVEIMLNLILKQLGINYPGMGPVERRRRRKLSGAWVASRFITRMKRVLSGIRRRKRGGDAAKNGRKVGGGGTSRIKPIVRTNTRPDLRKRRALMETYVNTILSDGTYQRGHLAAPSTSHYECWRVGKSSTPLSGSVYGAAKQHKRGQLELREMASAFRDAPRSGRVVRAGDGSVSYLMRVLKRSRHRWEFVAGRIESRDVSGIVINQRAMIVIKRKRSY